MKLKDKIADIWGRLCRWFVSVNWRHVGRKVIDFIGRIMHKILFEWLMPKKYRGIKKKEIFQIIFLSDTPAGKKFDIWLLILMLIVGAVMIVKGSDVTVDAACAIAKMFGMEERFIGLTIIAFGTSLPELVTSVTAALKKKPDIAVGNIVGSNIFNILFVVGTTALITPVQYASSFLVDSIVALAAAVLLFLCVIKNRRLGRLGGALMLIGYACYFAYIL